MNYRHAYHAGNHTEVFKHSVLVALIRQLQEKPTPIVVIDTHAGIGVYDLLSEPSRKTNEAQNGVGAIFSKSIPSAEAYLSILRYLNPDGLVRYPGSPSIIRALLRDNDRLIAVELHKEDAAKLRLTFKDDRQVAIHQRDGYEALFAFIPPAQRRGLVFVDPPFESKDEFRMLATKLITAYHKWPTGVFAAWYPIKSRAAPQRLIGELRASGIFKCLSTEFLRYPLDGTTLAGSGIVLINPPWKLDDKLRVLCAELADAFGGMDGRWSVSWVSGA
jgi:23S rRNA (adenine2030-N6)-methyltransferase